MSIWRVWRWHLLFQRHIEWLIGDSTFDVSRSFVWTERKLTVERKENRRRKNMAISDWFSLLPFDRLRQPFWNIDSHFFLFLVERSRNRIYIHAISAIDAYELIGFVHKSSYFIFKISPCLFIARKRTEKKPLTQSTRFDLLLSADADTGTVNEFVEKRNRFFIGIHRWRKKLHGMKWGK